MGKITALLTFQIILHWLNSSCAIFLQSEEHIVFGDQFVTLLSSETLQSFSFSYIVLDHRFHPLRSSHLTPTFIVADQNRRPILSTLHHRDGIVLRDSEHNEVDCNHVNKCLPDEFNTTSTWHEIDIVWDDLSRTVVIKLNGHLAHLSQSHVVLINESNEIVLEESQPCVAVGGLNPTHPVPQCQFPFEFNGEEFSDCVPFTTDLLPYFGNETMRAFAPSYFINGWCATVEEYVSDNQWGFCDCRGGVPIHEIVLDGKEVFQASFSSEVKNGNQKWNSDETVFLSHPCDALALPTSVGDNTATAAAAKVVLFNRSSVAECHMHDVANELQLHGTELILVLDDGNGSSNITSNQVTALQRLNSTLVYYVPQAFDTLLDNPGVAVVARAQSSPLRLNSTETNPVGFVSVNIDAVSQLMSDSRLLLNTSYDGSSQEATPMQRVSNVTLGNLRSNPIALTQVFKSTNQRNQHGRSQLVQLQVSLVELNARGIRLHVLHPSQVTTNSTRTLQEEQSNLRIDSVILEETSNIDIAFGFPTILSSDLLVVETISNTTIDENFQLTFPFHLIRIHAQQDSYSYVSNEAIFTLLGGNEPVNGDSLIPQNGIQFEFLNDTEKGIPVTLEVSHTDVRQPWYAQIVEAPKFGRLRDSQGNLVEPTTRVSTTTTISQFATRVLSYSSERSCCSTNPELDVCQISCEANEAKHLVGEPKSGRAWMPSTWNSGIETIQLAFQHQIFPETIRVYGSFILETVDKIFVSKSNTSNEWILVFDAVDQFGTRNTVCDSDDSCSVVFQICQIPVLTGAIRIEMNTISQTELTWTSINAVRLRGQNELTNGWFEESVNYYSHPGIAANDSLSWTATICPERIESSVFNKITTINQQPRKAVQQLAVRTHQEHFTVVSSFANIGPILMSEIRDTITSITLKIPLDQVVNDLGNRISIQERNQTFSMELALAPTNDAAATLLGTVKLKQLQATKPLSITFEKTTARSSLRGNTKLYLSITSNRDGIMEHVTYVLNSYLVPDCPFGVGDRTSCSSSRLVAPGKCNIATATQSQTWTAVCDCQFQSELVAGPSCSATVWLSCSGHGEPVFVGKTEGTRCVCEEGFGGPDCSWRENRLNMTSAIIELTDIGLRLENAMSNLETFIQVESNVTVTLYGDVLQVENTFVNGTLTGTSNRTTVTLLSFDLDEIVHCHGRGIPLQQLTPRGEACVCEELFLSSTNCATRTRCRIGQYINPKIITECLECPIGTYCPTGTERVPCPEGTLQINPGQAECFDSCASFEQFRVGHWLEKNETAANGLQCTLCKEGHECNGKEQRKCRPGEFAPRGADTCLSCSVLVGTSSYTNPTQSGCSLCPLNTSRPPISIGASVEECVCVPGTWVGRAQRDNVTKVPLLGVECEPCPEFGVCLGGTSTSFVITESGESRRLSNFEFEYQSIVNAGMSWDETEEHRQISRMGVEPQLSSEMGVEPQLSSEMGNVPQLSGEMGNEPQLSSEMGVEPQLSSAIEGKRHLFSAIEGKRQLSEVRVEFQNQDPINAEGAWGEPDVPYSFFPCDDHGGCLFNFTCSDSRTGIFCDQCADGFYQVGDDCIQCPDGTAGQYLLSVFGVTGLVLLWIVINHASEKIPALDVGLLYVQITSLVTAFDLYFPSPLAELNSIYGIADFDIDFLSPSCTINWSYTFHFGTQYCFPIVVLFVLVVINLAARLNLRYMQKQQRTQEENGDIEDIRTDVSRSFHSGLPTTNSTIEKRKRMQHRLLNVSQSPILMAAKQYIWRITKAPETEAEMKHFTNKQIAKFFNFLVIVYNSLCVVIFESFSCTTLESGKQVITSGPEVECWSDKHIWQHLIWSVLGLFVYVIGIPVALYVALTRAGTNDLKAERETMDRFGWAYKEFKQSSYRWELVLLARRFIFCLVLVAGNGYPYEQAIAGGVAVVLCMLAQLAYLPFLSLRINLLDIISLSTVFAYIFVGTVFTANEDNIEQFEWLSYTVTVMSIGTLILAFLIFLKDLRDTLRVIDAEAAIGHAAESESSAFIRCLRRLDVDEQQFQNNQPTRSHNQGHSQQGKGEKAESSTKQDSIDELQSKQQSNVQTNGKHELPQHGSNKIDTGKTDSVIQQSPKVSGDTKMEVVTTNDKLKTSSSAIQQQDLRLELFYKICKDENGEELTPEQLRKFVKDLFGISTMRANELVTHLLDQVGRNSNGNMDKFAFAELIHANTPNLYQTELKNTIKAKYLLRWAKKAVKEERYLYTAFFFELDELIGNSIGDTGALSEYRNNEVAKFYRHFIRHFPFLLDWIVSADPKLVESFRTILVQLQETRKTTTHRGSLSRVINSIDRAPLMHWLAHAPHEQRELFQKVMLSVCTFNKLPLWIDSTAFKPQDSKSSLSGLGQLGDIDGGSSPSLTNTIDDDDENEEEVVIDLSTSIPENETQVSNQ